MPISVVDNKVLLRCEGVHLYHFAMSSCSQRVRLALAEKSIPWTSHHVDLDKMEHLSGAYQAINPNGYVPTLVHQGRVVVESIDIIRYLEERFAGPSLLPQRADSDIKMISKWLERADENQRALKTLTYEILFKSRGHYQDLRDVEYYAMHQKNLDLVEFVQDFHKGFSEHRVKENLYLARQFMRDLDRDLSEGPYIAGPDFSLADVATVINVHRYKLCKIPMGDNGHLRAWYERVSARPAFNTAILEWQ